MNPIIVGLILGGMIIADILLITKFDDHWRRIGIGNLIFTVLIGAYVILVFASK